VNTQNWYRYEELRPEQLAAVVGETPVAYWPLGLLEHHSWHLPVGFDGLKADKICTRLAERTGGVVLPTMWWGGGGGHDAFHWTLYQDESAAARIYDTTVRRLAEFGFTTIVTLAGHYPWLGVINEKAPAIRADYPNLQLLADTEMTIAPGVEVPGDHAAQEETSYGLALFPEFIDMTRLVAHEGNEYWPGGVETPQEDRHPSVNYDASSPQFAQMGTDAREATSERGQTHVDALVEALAAHIIDFQQGSE
jgi:creatinine amidohydrolase